MAEKQKNNPLHGITLEKLLNILVERYGWEELGKMVPISCFKNNPSIKSSLTFLRKTSWARERVEAIYIYGPPRRYFKQ
jgi:uncharacterized protein (DUF2132 family)